MNHLICKYCHFPIHPKVISIHLKSHHSINFLDYVKENLKEFEQFNWVKCVMCENICRSYSKSHKQPTCSTKCLTELRKTWTGENSIRYGTTLSEETKQKISISNLGREVPSIQGKNNPMHKKEVKDKAILTKKKNGSLLGNKNPMYGKTHTLETIQKIFSHRKMNKLEKIVANALDSAGIEYVFSVFYK